MAVAGQVDHPERLATEEITLDSGGHKLNAYFARPGERGRYPGVVVIHDVFGIGTHFPDIARRLANVGIMAIVPNLFSRAATEPKPDDMPGQMARMFAVEDRYVVQDLEAAADYLRARPESNGKVGAIGFCVGGRNTLLFACSSSKVNAAVDCWGGFIMAAGPSAETTPQRPVKVIDLVPNLHCPLYAVIGGEDQNPSPAQGEELRARLEKAGKANLLTVEVFDGAGHAFFHDQRPSYREKQAFAMWSKAVEFFKHNLS